MLVYNVIILSIPIFHLFIQVIEVHAAHEGVENKEFRQVNSREMTEFLQYTIQTMR